MQDFAGSTVVHYQGALAALAGALLLGPRIGKFDGSTRRGNPIPGHNIPYAVLGTIILWFGWFGFNPGSTLGVVTGNRVGFFAYVALTTNLAAAAGALSGALTAWVVLRKPDISMMLNCVLAALVAVTAASGFVAPWAAVVIGLVSGVIAVVGVLWVERIGIDDPIGAFTVSASFGCLWTMKRLWGIRVEEETETAGLDVSEHGMWGYPEFYIPVPGGYGTEAHSHLLGHSHTHAETPAPADEVEEAA